MLKIKDYVDLKVLEKYGFDYDLDLNTGLCLYRNGVLFVENRIIKQMDRYNEFKEIDYEFGYYEIMIIFDLIQAGIIEKVEE
jgi:hypothetical protein